MLCRVAGQGTSVTVLSARDAGLPVAYESCRDAHGDSFSSWAVRVAAVVGMVSWLAVLVCCLVRK